MLVLSGVGAHTRGMLFTECFTAFTSRLPSASEDPDARQKDRAKENRKAKLRQRAESETRETDDARFGACTVGDRVS